MKNYGRTALCEFLEDRVVYRNLNPADPSLPTLSEMAARVALPAGRIPRKTEADYARVIVHLLQRAQELRGKTRSIQRVLFVGDTRLLDGSAFGNICTAGNWPGLAFIGSENTKPPSIEIVPNETGQSLYLANRWTALEEYAGYAVDHDLPIDESTAVILDIDKTCLGARGRNGHVLDSARVQAVYNTVSVLLGQAFDEQAFRTAYDLLNQPEFHHFTGDNQDYLAYVCLMLGSGLYSLERTVGEIRSRKLVTFDQFLQRINARAAELPSDLAAIHAEIYGFVLAGDPTPFKTFRRNEYLVTIGRFGHLGDTDPLEKLLQEEIVVTQEVREGALQWQKQGALLFGLSDKPDEASLPTPELAGQGYLPLHRTITHAIGE